MKSKVFEKQINFEKITRLLMLRTYKRVICFDYVLYRLMLILSYFKSIELQETEMLEIELLNTEQIISVN